LVIVMKSFEFKLQPVLDYREKKEDFLKKELAEVKKKYECEKKLLDDLVESLRISQEEFKEKQMKGLDINEFFVYSCYLTKIQEDIYIQILRVRAILVQVEAVREKLIGASKDKKVMEKLYDKQYEEFCQMLLRSEQKLLDELATSRHKRKEIASLFSEEGESA